LSFESNVPKCARNVLMKMTEIVETGGVAHVRDRHPRTQEICGFALGFPQRSYFDSLAV
jgi:hypothetical protein